MGSPAIAVPARQASAADIEPALLLWDQASTPTPKTIAVRASAGGSAKVSNVISSTPNFEAKLESVKESSEYRIIVTPKSTGKPELAFLTIEVDSGAGPAIQRAYVQIASVAK